MKRKRRRSQRKAGQEAQHTSTAATTRSCGADWKSSADARRKRTGSGRNRRECGARKRPQRKKQEENSRSGTAAPQSHEREPDRNRALAAISYLSVLFAIPYIFAPNDSYAKFHAKQGLKLFLFGIAADILTGIIGLGWIATLARFYLIYKGMTNALNGKKEPLPYIGTLGDQ